MAIYDSNKLLQLVTKMLPVYVRYMTLEKDEKELLKSYNLIQSDKLPKLLERRIDVAGARAKAQN